MFDNLDQVQKAVKILEDFAKEADMKINVSKCALLHNKYSKNPKLNDKLKIKIQYSNPYLR